jgi:hypothetical protein
MKTKKLYPSSQNYQTLKQANYSYIRKTGSGHILKDNNTGALELFAPSKNYAGWALIYKNTHLEFCCTVEKPNN